MDYEGTGRKLGTGLKVLGRMAKQRMADSEAPRPPTPRQPSAPTTHSTRPQPTSPPTFPPTSRPAPAAKSHANIREAGRQFGKSVWGPFSRAGHVLWLEITGLFFALFALGFGTQAWKLRNQWRAGDEHTHFVTYAVLTIVFVYFCITSFARAKRRGRR